jgi:hypothetical protein
MSSSINPYNVDGTFPVAGQDNSSQGFRDNFTSIQNNFIFAKAELDDLQSKVLVTNPLNGQALTNNMGGTQIIAPQLKAWTEAILDLGTVSSSATLDFSAGNFQKITTSGGGSATTLGFAHWPTVGTGGTAALGYGVLRLWVVITGVNDTLVLPSSVSIGVGDIAGYVPGSHSITFDAPGNYVFDFSSIDGGSTYLIFDLTRNRSTFRDPGFYYNNGINSTVLIGYDGGLQTVLALEQGQDLVSAKGSYNSVSVGNLTLANVTYTQIDTGGVAGYSVTSARGNLSIGTINPVQSSDLIGYVNSIAFTGNGTSNVFQQVSSIDFFATGSNVAYGLGGNIAFFTADDGGLGPNKMNQAVGIENDQSVKFFGNVVTSGAAIDRGYQYLGSPSTGFNQVVQSGKSRLIIDPATTLATGTVTLPSGNVASGGSGDGTIISISSTAQITSLTVNTVSGAVKPSSAFQLNAGTGVQFFWHASEYTWYKIA